MQKTKTTTPLNLIWLFISFIFISFFLLLPTIVDVITGIYQKQYLLSLGRLGVSFLLFLVPLVFFHKNIKLYLYLLSSFILLTPLFIIAFIWFKVRPNFSLIAFLLQTNLAEVKEATKGLLKPILLVSFGYLLFYLIPVWRFSVTRIPFRTAAIISGFALAVSTVFFLGRKYNDGLQSIEILEENYPVSLFSGLGQAFAFMQKNNLNAAKDFRFNAYQKDSLSQRQVYVLIIGESQRYDRWEINGYPKPTSPRLKARPNLVSFSRAVSGSNLTWLAIPQIITRANPTNMDLQFEEKSILGAFKEAGFKTVWLSNQTDKDIFWSGTINLHAKTADVAVFSPSQSSTLDSKATDTYDERLLPLLDSIIKADDQNLFVVLHTMGNHWEYSNRYPKNFDLFQPSGKTEGYLNPHAASGKEAISNSYDNNIRYADFVIDSVINILNHHQLVSTVTFLSDHGEDLFDRDPNRMDFHVTPAPATLHIPFFIWTSNKYNSLNKEKARLLTAHQAHKIGTENAFYTVLDLAHIGFPGFNFHKSIAHPAFEESAQIYYHNLDKKAYPYARLIK